MSTDLVSFVSKEIALSGLVIFAVASCAALLCRRCRAAVRHAIWSLAFAGTFVSPVVSTFLPNVNIPVPIGSPQETRTAKAPPSSLSDFPRQTNSNLHGIVEPQAQTSRSAGAVQIDSEGEPSSKVEPLWSGLVLAWMIVAGLFLLKLGADVWRMISWTRRAVTIDQPNWISLLSSLTDEIRVSKRTRLAVSTDVPVPVTWGVWRPVILLPMEAITWEIERCRLALRHELNHIRRGDYIWNALGYLSRLMHWFNPLAWYAHHKLLEERERATDDCVLRHGAESHTYAAYLLEGVQSLFDVGPVPRTPSAMGSSSNLRSRLQFILDDGACRAPLSRLIAAFLLASATAVVGTVAVASPTVVASDWQATASTAEAMIELANDDSVEQKRATRMIDESGDDQIVVDTAKDREDEDAQVRASSAGEPSKGEGYDMTRALMTLALLASPPPASTGDSETVAGSEKIVTEARPLAEFDVVELRTSGDVEVTIGQPASLTIKGDDNVLPLITTEVNDGRLVISAKSAFRASQPIEVRVTVADLDAAVLSGSGTMSVRGLENKNFYACASGSGSLKLAGKTKQLAAAVTGSGDILAFDLEAHTVALAGKDSGDAEIAAKESLSVLIEGSGNIDYIGEPTVYNIIKGSGKVRKSK